MITVKNTTTDWINSVTSCYSRTFSRWCVGNRYEKYQLSAEEIQKKVDEIIGDCQQIEAVYQPLKVRLTGVWSPSKRSLSIGYGSGDNWGEDVISCKTLSDAERLMVRAVRDLIPAIEANL